MAAVQAARASLPRRPPRAQWWVGVLLASLAAARAEVATATRGARPPLRPSSGVALGALLLGGSTLWSVAAAGVALGELSGGVAPLPALLQGLGAAAGALAAARLLRRAGLRLGLERPRDAVLLALIAPLGATVAAAAGLLGAAIVDPASPGGPLGWVGAWAAEVLGCLLVAPLLLAWSQPPPRRRCLEWIALACAALGAGLLVCGLFPGVARLEGELYLTFPLLLWAAARMGLHGALVTSGLVAVAAVGSTLTGAGPFAGQHPECALHGFLGVFSLSALVLGTVSGERERVLHALRRTRVQLEARVEERAGLLARANEALRQREQQLLQVQRLAHVGSWSWDLAADEVTWSDEMATLLGGPRSGVSGAMFLSLVHPEDRRRVRRALEEARAEQPCELEHRVQGPDGVVRHLVHRLKRTPAAAGGGARILGTAVDVTAHREAELAHVRLRRAEVAHYHAIVESAGAAIVSADLEGNVTSWNAGAERLYGWSRGEMLGQPLALLIDAAPEDQPSWSLARRGGALEVDEQQRRRKDGKPISVALTLSPIRDEEGRIVGISEVSQDLSARKRMERELARSNAELEKFASVTSHDLQEPARMVASFSRLLREEYAARLDARGARWLELALEGAERMLRMIQDLLDYSRVQTAPRTPAQVDCGQAVREALENLRAPGSDAARVEVGPLPVVYGDRSQLLRLFQNLLGNALKFRSERPLELEVRAEARPGEGWLFRVRDNGVGVPEDQRARVFEPFVRLHARERYRGTGIGLALCRAIVERHGGRIWLEGSPGGGTTACFTLPEGTAGKEARA